METHRCLNAESPEILYLSRVDKRLAKVIQMVGPIEFTRHPNPFEFLVHEIVEQMLSVKAGKVIFDRLTEKCGGEISPESILKLNPEEMRSTGMSNAKGNYIQNLANAVKNGQLSFSIIETLPDIEAIKYLSSFRGIGAWTAKMYLIFVLWREDVLPFEDGAFMQSYRWLYKTAHCQKDEVIKKCSKWSPYSSIAARYLYRVLDLGYTAEEFHLL